MFEANLMEEDLTVIIPEAKKVGSYVKMEDLWVEWVAAQPPMDEFKANKSFFNSTKPSRNHLKWKIPLESPYKWLKETTKI